MNKAFLQDLGRMSFITVLVALGMAALWGGVGLLRGGTCGWMALVAAFDAAVLLRLAGIRSGRQRAWVAVMITLAAVLAGAFTVAALRIGVAFGSPPHEALWRIEPSLAMTWWRLNLGPWDVVCLLASLPLSWRLGR